MKSQVLAHETVIYYHTCWTCVSCDTVQGDHSGHENLVSLADNVYVSWDHVFLTDVQAQEDLQRMTKCKERKSVTND